MPTTVEKILNEIMEGKIEVDDAGWYHTFYPAGLPLYLDVIERPFSVSTSATVS
jgi:hypothetical protein